MNITHSEPMPVFVGRYGARQTVIAPLLEAFGPQQLREWIGGLGIETFVGSSGRVFPTEMKAAPLLRAWLHRLRGAGVQFHVRHRWLGWAADGALRFATPEGEKLLAFDAVILALGGGSWARLGSDGAWVPLLAARGVRGGALEAGQLRLRRGVEPAFQRALRRPAGQAGGRLGGRATPAGRVQHHRRRHRRRAGLCPLGAAARCAGHRRSCRTASRSGAGPDAGAPDRRSRTAARARFAGQPPAPAGRDRRRQGRPVARIAASRDVDRDRPPGRGNQASAACR